MPLQLEARRARSMKNQFNIFENDQDKEETLKKSPLAYIARPKEFNSFVGQDHIFKRFTFLKDSNFPSMVLWGPPGVGKTTLAHILADNSKKELYPFNAVLGGVNDLKKLINSASEVQKMFKKESIIFIDEIHRFNKAQQDALLPYIEKGSFTLIGATTENPRRSINNALLSRLQIIELKSLNESNLTTILKQTAESFNINCDEKIINFIADYSGGDARKALNSLEIVQQIANENEVVELENIRELILENARNFDRNQDRHYDVISAFIKSLRGSNPDAALLWLAIMLDGGEDPMFIARRLVIFASEDIGNADIHALPLAVSAMQAVQNIGMPESRINLGQVTTYLASTVKSNASYKAINEAIEYVENNSNIPVPEHLRNFPPENATSKYIYPHNCPGNFIKQNYTVNKTPNFYRPTDMGHEKNLKIRLENLWESELT